MSETNRRKFLAAAGVSAAAGTVAIASGGGAAAVARSANGAKEPVLAVVPDHRSSEVRLLVGEREVVVHDRDLATRILNAAGGD